MDPERLRRAPNIAIVGSTSLLGKELQEMLEARGFPVGRMTLLETEEYAGLLQEFSGEIQITQVISPSAFEDVDLAFFTCSPEIMQSYAGSGAKFPDLTIDLTQAGREGILYLHGISDSRVLRQHGYFVNPHPAAIVIARVLSELHNTFTVQSASVTILEPASQRGGAGVDELQEQTVSLLNFQPVESKVFAGQLAFNMLPEQDVSTRSEDRVQQQLIEILGRTFPQPMLTAVQAPVFYSHAFSMFVQLHGWNEHQDVSAHLGRNAAFSVGAPPGGPSPVGVVGSDKIHIGMVRLNGNHADKFALWAVADNLRIAAASAIQTATQIMLMPALDA